MYLFIILDNNLLLCSNDAALVNNFIRILISTFNYSTSIKIINLFTQLDNVDLNSIINSAKVCDKLLPLLPKYAGNEDYIYEVTHFLYWYSIGPCIF